MRNKIFSMDEFDRLPIGDVGISAFPVMYKYINTNSGRWRVIRITLSSYEKFIPIIRVPAPSRRI